MKCDKTEYQSFQEAVKAARGVSRDTKQPMMAYRCEVCGKYHLATRGKRKRIPQVKPKLSVKIDRVAPLNPLPKVIRPEAPRYATYKLLSYEQAEALKRLIEGKTAMEKQSSLNDVDVKT